jgi:dCMP deaminase
MRKDIDEYFIELANLVGSRSTCDRGKPGCVIVRDKNILSTGYAGSPKGIYHCDEIGHEMEDNHCIRTTHAEANAICQAAKNGTAIKDSTLYCTMTPCYNCAKMIINSGVIKVVVDYDYHDSSKSKEIFFRSGIDLVIINKEVKEY